MNQSELTLISHHLCPYVQRAAIALQEKDVPFERRNIDLGAKPDWFPKLSPKWQMLAANLGNGPWFDGDTFSLVDAAFAPAFRYFEVFEQLGDIDFFPAVRKVSLWRRALANRPSVQSAVASDYHSQLLSFLAAKNSVIGRLAMRKLATNQEEAA